MLDRNEQRGERGGGRRCVICNAENYLFFLFQKSHRSCMLCGRRCKATAEEVRVSCHVGRDANAQRRHYYVQINTTFSLKTANMAATIIIQLKIELHIPKILSITRVLSMRHSKSEKKGILRYICQSLFRSRLLCNAVVHGGIGVYGIFGMFSPFHNALNARNLFPLFDERCSTRIQWNGDFFLKGKLNWTLST